MAVSVSYPGVYIQEVPSGSRAIAGVPTSVAAFVGYAVRGPVNDPVQIFSFADFERNFGGLNLDSDLSYAVNHYFLNGGSVAWIVRVAENAGAASVDLQDLNGNPTLRVTASSEGAWGNALVVRVDYATSQPTATFNVTVSELAEQNGRLVAVRTETHRNLSMNDAAPTYARDAINTASDLIEVEDLGLPITVPGTSESGEILAATISGLTDSTRQIGVSIDGGPVFNVPLFPLGNNNLNTLQDLADAIAAAVQALDAAYAGFSVAPTASGIIATAPPIVPGSRASAVSFRNAPSQNAAAVLHLGQVNGGREIPGAAEIRPASTGTSGGRIADFSGVTLADNDQVDVNVVAITDTGTAINTLTVTLNPAPTSLADARTQFQNSLHASTNPAFSGATVAVIDDALVFTAGGSDPSLTLTFDNVGPASAADELELTASAFVNVSGYQPGVGPTGGAQVAGTTGADGVPPTTPAQVVGSRAQKTGFYALEDVDLFNILNLPGETDVSALAEAVAYAEERRSMILIDLPATVDNLDDARDWLNDSANSSLIHRNAAVYFPRVRLADPLLANRLRSFANSGLMAGLWARTDAQRGVWKAPAGIDARLRGVQALDYVLSDPENGVLNPLGLNCLRTFPVFGTVSWGARTRVGADALTSEWKYIPVRRLALFIEESLYRGTQFVVFEPNDEPLWAQIRLSVGSFMNNLFRQGAFQGKTPQEAYLVRCDSSTTTQADIDLGIVNILVGFAPLKPAEFVIIQIQQLAGQGQA